MRKHDDGFTLIEMMVVVAIIGVLSAIAIPAYNRYLSKARQSEAKLHLSSIYTAEQAFSIEQGTYTTCLSQIGFGVMATKQYYSYGIPSSWTTGTNCGKGANLACDLVDYSGISATTCNNADSPPSDTFYQANITAVPYSNPNVSMGGPPTQANMDNCTGVVAAYPRVDSPTHFAYEAVGVISSSPKAAWGDHGMDCWTIDSTNTLVNAAPGI